VTAKLLDGKSLARTIQDEIAAEVASFRAAGGARPCLATVLVGEDPASEVYVRNKRQACERVGMESRHHPLPASTSQAELLELVGRLNADAGVHGILVQLPLPKHIDESRILVAVDPA
jgi:methylenetetrahydrofolate dehydrogenase (NADP+)/methenyltetrahydrofolate cyclohydrolase